MAIQYYTMEEAARILGTTPDELKQLAKRGELRPFQDRGTLRFRTQEIDELARRRGRGSDSAPELQLGEAQGTRQMDASATKKPGATDSGKTQKPEDSGAGVFDFTLDAGDDQVEIGQELRSGATGSGQRKSPSGKNLSGSPSPTPKPGSDSDVRLVADGSDLGFQIASDSDVKMVDDQGPTSSVLRGGSPKTPRPKASQPDSGVRVLPMESGSDSDVKIVPDSSSEHDVVVGKQGPRSGSDSDIRLEGPAGQARTAGGSGKGKRQDALPTEEIDLDAELKQAEKAAKAQKKPKTAHKKPASEAALPSESPFELSADDLEKSGKKKESSPDSSSDFDLTPAAADQSPIDVGSDEISLQVGDDEVGLGEISGGAGESGINLQDPADSGISLEQPEGSSDSIEFELSLDEDSSGGGTTPKPGKGARASKPAPAPADQVDSDSEFELTLDDSGGLAPLEEEGASPESSGEEKDIFETDFEVPALDDESGSQAVALDESDTDLESSDFDLALGDEDATSDEESGSQVVALEDEEADDAAETVARRGRAGAEEEEVEELLGDEETEAAEGGRRVPVMAAAPANWGALPAAIMLPCVIVMFIVSFMGFELIHGMWGYRQPYKVSGTIVDGIARAFTDDLPKE